MNTPQMEALQASALPQIQKMMNLNPLSNYAAWSPRQIAGSNPAYDQLFAQANRLSPALNGLSLIFGEPPMTENGAGLAVPNMTTPPSSTAAGGPLYSGITGLNGTTPAPPPQFQPQNIQDIVNAQVQEAVAQKVNTLGKTNDDYMRELLQRHYSGQEPDLYGAAAKIGFNPTTVSYYQQYGRMPMYDQSGNIIQPNG